MTMFIGETIFFSPF